MENYIIVIEKAESNYCAYSPDVPGCITTGPSPEVIVDNWKEAIDGHLECMAEDGEELPRAKGLVWHLQNNPGFVEPGDFLIYIEVDLAKYQAPAHA